jgi:RHS repeat-associated protein
VTENGTPVGTYAYDSNGNRNSTGYTTGTDNEQTASPGYTYTYDNAGNMISDTNTSTHVTTTFTYDYRNRLTEVTTGGTVVATYTYNALNQRIGVKDSGTQTWTVYNGASADANPYADFKGSGSLTERYLFGPSVVNGAVVNGILARTSSGGTIAWYLTDKLGSVDNIVDTSGNVLDTIVYDSFGNIVSESDAANGDRFKFAGMQYDATIGQYFDQARWYGSASGRFFSLDPKGFAAGDSDLYRYVGNAPTNMTDPSGMDGTGVAVMAGSAGFLQAAAVAVVLSQSGTTIAALPGGGAVLTGAAVMGAGVLQAAASASAAITTVATIAVPVSTGVGAVVIGAGVAGYLGYQWWSAYQDQLAAQEVGASLNVQLAWVHMAQYNKAYFASINADIINFVEAKTNWIKQTEQMIRTWDTTGILPPQLPPGKDPAEWLNEKMRLLNRLLNKPWPPGSGPRPPYDGPPTIPFRPA